MTDNQCKKALDEFKQATIEWTQAAEASKVFKLFEPLSPYQDVKVMPPEFVVRMRRAFKIEEDAKNKYMAKYQALVECRQKHKVQIS